MGIHSIHENEEKGS